MRQIQSQYIVHLSRARESNSRVVVWIKNKVATTFAVKPLPLSSGGRLACNRKHLG